jgi:hypothetical protein
LALTDSHFLLRGNIAHMASNQFLFQYCCAATLRIPVLLRGKDAQWHKLCCFFTEQVRPVAYKTSCLAILKRELKHDDYLITASTNHDRQVKKTEAEAHTRRLSDHGAHKSRQIGRKNNSEAGAQPRRLPDYGAHKSQQTVKSNS